MKSLIKKIKKVTKALLDMGYRADEAVSFALKALFENDEMLAKKVIANDDKLDNLENKIDRMCLNIFALNQPVAIDLRSVLMVSKIDTDYERIGDLACLIADKAANIAKKAKTYKLYPEEKIKNLGVMIQKSLKETIECYIQEDVDMAKEIIFKDTEINELHNEIVKDIIKKAAEDVENLRFHLDIIDVIKCLERIGDHLSNICEDVIFIETGEIVKHKRIVS